MLKALRESYQSYQKVSSRGLSQRLVGSYFLTNASSLRRYLLYAADILDIYLSIRRDRRYRDEW